MIIQHVMIVNRWRLSRKKAAVSPGVVIQYTLSDTVLIEPKVWGEFLLSIALVAGSIGCRSAEKNGQMSHKRPVSNT
jgi:hypothetical protein